MVRLATAFSILVLSAVRVIAAPDLMVMGDALVAKYDTPGPRGGLIEFIPADESVENWTRLVGSRADLAAAPDAAGAAAAVAGRARQRYPG